MGIFNIIGIGLIVSGMIYYQFARQFKKKAIRNDYRDSSGSKFGRG